MRWYSSEETMTTAGLRCLVTVCAPCFIARSTTSLNRLLASCSCHTAVFMVHCPTHFLTCLVRNNSSRVQTLHHGLGAGTDLELFVEGANVGADGVDGHSEAFTRFFVEATLRETAQNSVLALRELCQW